MRLRQALMKVTLALAAIPAAPAAERPPVDPSKLYLVRFEFDNDTFLRSDDSFTAGWSLQIHSRFDDTWHAGYAKWIGRLPGLHDDGRGGRVARWAYGIGQVLITPRDITTPEPQPDDAPWAGILSGAASWSAYDNRRMAGLQIMAGCMGPCSGAEGVQKFVHNTLHTADSPRGWDNQLAQQWLGNVNYEYRHKLFQDYPEDYGSGRFVHDMSLGSQIGLGNLARFIWGQVEYRFGWGMPQGFTKTAEPAGFGMMLDPVYFDPAGPPPELYRWRNYVTLVGRVAYINHLAPAEGGPTVNGGEHPGLDSEPGKVQMLVGYHFGRVPYSWHVTYYRYFREERIGIRATSDWINVSFEYRF